MDNDGAVCCCKLCVLCEEVVIKGGNHAYIGSYGFQDGDGRAEISMSDQIDFTAEKIKEFAFK